MTFPQALYSCRLFVFLIIITTTIIIRRYYTRLNAISKTFPHLEKLISRVCFWYWQTEDTVVLTNQVLAGGNAQSLIMRRRNGKQTRTMRHGLINGWRQARWMVRRLGDSRHIQRALLTRCCSAALRRIYMRRCIGPQPPEQVRWLALAARRSPRRVYTENEKSTRSITDAVEPEFATFSRLCSIVRLTPRRHCQRQHWRFAADSLCRIG